CKPATKHIGKRRSCRTPSQEQSGHNTNEINRLQLGSKAETARGNWYSVCSAINASFHYRTAHRGSQMEASVQCGTLNPGPAPSPTTTGRLKVLLSRGGLYYSSLYAMRWLTDRTRDFLDRCLVAVERRKGLVEPWTIGARRYTSTDNKQLWNSY